MMLFFLVFFSLVSAKPLAGVYGADVSQLVGTSSWACLKTKHAVNFVVPRGYRSLGSVDPAAGANLANAAAAGIADRSVYFFPAFKVKSANASVDEFHSAAKSWTSFNRVWLDIEGASYWSGSCDANVQYMEDLVHRLQAWGYAVGVYCSASQWSVIACSRLTKLSALPLWYAHYDENPSFSDFRPFGGWTTPYAKQYRGGHDECGANIDANWRP